MVLFKLELKLKGLKENLHFFFVFSPLVSLQVASFVYNVISCSVYLKTSKSGYGVEYVYGHKLYTHG